MTANAPRPLPAHHQHHHRSASRALFTPQQERDRNAPSTFLRARSAAQLLQHFPLAEIVLFNEHAKAAFCPRFFICFPQTRKKENRQEKEKREKGKKTGRGEELKENTHACTHTEVKKFQVTAKCCCFFDRITDDVRRSGKSLESSAVIGPMSWEGAGWGSMEQIFRREKQTQRE